MKKAVVFIISICVLCVSISGAAISVNKTVTVEEIPIDERFIVNQPTESPEINTQILENMNQEVDKYLNFGEYNGEEIQTKEIRDIEYPWQKPGPLPLGDFVDWIIYVNYKEIGGEEKHFQQEININPANLKDRFLDHPWHYEMLSFDTNEDGTDDLEVYYSIFNSQLFNGEEGIDAKSIRTCLKVRAEDMLVRDAKLEVWSEIKLNYGLIKEFGRGYDRPVSLEGRFGELFDKFFENIRSRVENIKSTLFRDILNKFIGRVLPQPSKDIQDPGYQVTAEDSDWLALGIGIVSPEGEFIPNYYEKYLNVAKENIFSPIVFEQELRSISSSEELGLLFGFQAGHENQQPTLDVAFEIDFDPAFHVRTQFVPRDAYVYYFYDTGSGCNQKPSITFTTNGFGIDDVELSLVFDSTTPLATSKNWMSFEIDIFGGKPGFKYKANTKHSVAFIATSPIFSGKIKVNEIPSRVTLSFDVDLSFVYQQGQLLDAEGTGSLTLDMNDKLGSVIMYYPELSSEEPLIELVKVSGVPATQTLSVNAHILVDNDTYTTIHGDGYVDLTMSSSLSRIQVFYRKADPNDPDKLLIDVPSGVPASNRVGAEATLYMNLNDFSAINNYVYGRAYRSSSGNIQRIDGYLPGASDPIVSITQIPAQSEGKAKLIWNKLEGYAYANRQTAGGDDPIDINVDIGTIHVHNYLEILNGFIDCKFHLAQDGYFYFDTSDEILGDTLDVTDASTGNQICIDAYKISADQLDASWDLDLSADPIEVNELAFSGKLKFLQDLTLSATYSGKNLDFDTSWTVGQSGEFSVDFYQDDPVEIYIEDLFEDDPTWDVGGGITISDNFHFDVKWEWGDYGEFKINEDTNDPNFDWVGFRITYDPSGSNNPTYGIDVSGTNIGLLVYMEWAPGGWLPQVWWYVYVSGTFDIDLLWQGDWYYNVEEW